MKHEKCMVCKKMINSYAMENHHEVSWLEGNRDKSQVTRICANCHKIETLKQRTNAGQKLSLQSRVLQVKECKICGYKGCELHHMIPLKNGGPHILKNAIQLCPTHHRIVHLDPFVSFNIKLLTNNYSTLITREEYTSFLKNNCAENL